MFTMSFTGLLVLGIFALPLLVGAVVLQIFLSKRKNPLFGLFLPALSFVVSILLPIVLLFSGYGFCWAVILFFILANIPTVILFVIYIICRATKPKQPQPVQLDLHNELNKMNIQDLD